ncbi:hypothetical protein EVG20_g2154 [Dentipellis fragilis]|uniref:XPG-I domain-containing protein n=1 Tax=Dentipellis fragilis TaxID=205917 RepID=A0A4Y9ZA18_9AGAM|nr:hypothetical protein EVG20_g2154 [Dentipellis fragilis]
MGVQGLWDIIHKTGQSRALAHLAVVDGFESNASGKRAYRVGIDASLWYTHASFSKGGENPELRLLFFRLKSLAALPLLPLFVFDGRERPKVKRGSRMGKSGSHQLTEGMRRLLDIFGMEWRMADGEAEAELARLNELGVIDAIMTDDVDAFVFGARTIIRNPGTSLSGNKSRPAFNLDGKESKDHVMVYTADAIRNDPSVGLTRAGMILIALLSGGDYHKGVEKFGPGIAHALARCGFGDKLLDIFNRRTEEDIRVPLAQWRDAVHNELALNSRGFLSRRYPSYTLPPDFPPLDIMQNYVNPVNSARFGRQGGGAIRDNRIMNIPRLAAFCEAHFGEWGYKKMIIDRFRNFMWESATLHVLRRAALKADELEKTKRIKAGSSSTVIHGLLKSPPHEAVGTPVAFVEQNLSEIKVDRLQEAFVNRGPVEAELPQPTNKNALKMKIVGSRRHVSTDRILEYRVELCPSIFVALAEKGITGKRGQPPSREEIEAMDPFNVEFDPSSQRKVPRSPKKLPAHPDSPMRMWIPVSMIQQVHPDLVAKFEADEAAKKAGKGKGKRTARGSSPDFNTEDEAAPPSSYTSSQPFPAASQASSSNSYAETRSHVDSRQPTTLNSPATQTSTEVQRTSTSRPAFLFWFPNPDDPDHVAVEDGLALPREALPAQPPQLPPRLPPTIPRTSVPTPPSTVPSSTRVSTWTPAGPSTRQVAANEDDLEEPPRDHLDDYFDSMFGMNPRGAAGLKAAGRRGRPSASALTGNIPRTVSAPQRAAVPNFGMSASAPGPSVNHRPRPIPVIPPATFTQASTPASTNRPRVNSGPPRGLQSSQAGQGQRPDRFDEICDRILGVRDTAPPAPLPLSPSKRRRTTAPIVISDSIVDLTEEPAAKRPRATHELQGTPTAPQPCASQRRTSYPGLRMHGSVIDLSDDDDVPAPPSRPAAKPTTAYSTPYRPPPSQSQTSSSSRGRRFYPPPSSSQESGLLSDVSVVIDLT